MFDVGGLGCQLLEWCVIWWDIGDKCWCEVLCGGLVVTATVVMCDVVDWWWKLLVWCDGMVVTSMGIMCYVVGKWRQLSMWCVMWWEGFDNYWYGMWCSGRVVKSFGVRWRTGVMSDLVGLRPHLLVWVGVLMLTDIDVICDVMEWSC